MLKFIARLLNRRVRSDGEMCENCQHFIDHRDLDDDPPDELGYCGWLVDTYGLEKACEMSHGYGGHWTHGKSWCRNYEEGPSLWSASEGDTTR